MAHRLLLCAGLAQGESIVRGLAPSEDVKATIDCLRALGASVDIEDGCATIKGANPLNAESAVLPCRESGSTLRFFIPLCMLSGNEIKLTGSKTLLKRPLSIYADIASERNLPFAADESGVCVAGPLEPGVFEMVGNVSSQFVSGLLFALPLLTDDSIIRLRPPVESRSYIDMTLSALRTFGIDATWLDETTIAIPGNQRYRAQNMTVEGDWSNAAFFLALGVDVEGLDDNSLQGDKICADYFARLDAGDAQLDISNCPDLGPILFAYAAMHDGATFTGTDRLRIKESDRGAAMRDELRKFGVDVLIGDNRIVVGSGLHAPTESLDGHNDHRIVMALSVLCTQTGGTIHGAEAVAKSYPNFFEQLHRAGIELEASNAMDI